LWGLISVTTSDHVFIMKAVGVKQLKARLSELLRAVRAGEVILVTDRDEVVAELRPAGWPAPVVEPDEVLALPAEAGEVTRAQVAKGRWRWSVRGLGLPRGTAEELLNQLRGDR